MLVAFVLFCGFAVSALDIVTHLRTVAITTQDPLPNAYFYDPTPHTSGYARLRIYQSDNCLGSSIQSWAQLGACIDGTVINSIGEYSINSYWKISTSHFFDKSCTQLNFTQNLELAPRGCQSDGSGISMAIDFSSSLQKKAFSDGILALSYSTVRECTRGVANPLQVVFTPYDWCLPQSYQSAGGIVDGSMGVGYCLESGSRSTGTRYASGLFLDATCSSKEFYPNGQGHILSGPNPNPLLNVDVLGFVPYHLDCQESIEDKPTSIQCVGGSYVSENVIIEPDQDGVKPTNSFLVLKRFTDPFQCTTNNSHWTEIYSVGTCIPQPSNQAYLSFTDLTVTGDQLSFVVSTFSDSKCEFPSSSPVEDVPGCVSSSCVFNVIQDSCVSNSGSLNSWAHQSRRPELPFQSSLQSYYASESDCLRGDSDMALYSAQLPVESCLSGVFGSSSAEITECGSQTYAVSLFDSSNCDGVEYHSTQIKYKCAFSHRGYANIQCKITNPSLRIRQDKRYAFLALLVLFLGIIYCLLKYFHPIPEELREPHPEPGHDLFSKHKEVEL